MLLLRLMSSARSGFKQWLSFDFWVFTSFIFTWNIPTIQRSLHKNENTANIFTVQTHIFFLQEKTHADGSVLHLERRGKKKRKKNQCTPCSLWWYHDSTYRSYWCLKAFWKANKFISILVLFYYHLLYFSLVGSSLTLNKSTQHNMRHHQVNSCFCEYLML